MTMKQTGPITLPDEVMSHKGEWVTLSGDLKRVVGYGSTGKKAYDMAEDAHEPHAFLLFIPLEPRQIFSF